MNRYLLLGVVNFGTTIACVYHEQYFYAVIAATLAGGCLAMGLRAVRGGE